MADYNYSLICRPNLDLDAETFSVLYSNWVALDPKPENILSYFEVTSVIHNKMPNHPEHEFLVIETFAKDNKSRLFVLDRCVCREKETTSERPDNNKKVEASTPSHLAKEDSSSSSPSLSLIDKATLITS